MTIGFIPEGKDNGRHHFTPLLRLEGISKRYGATLALNNVRFDLFAGEVHALMGKTARVNPR